MSLEVVEDYFSDGIVRAVSFFNSVKGLNLRPETLNENVFRLVKDIDKTILLDSNSYIDSEELDFFDNFIEVLNEKVK